MAKAYKAGIKTGFDVTDGTAIDKRLDLWPSRADALARIQGIQRRQGMLIPVRLNGVTVYHHFAGGLADIHFIPFDPRINQEDALLYAGVTFNGTLDEVTLTDTQWRISDVVFTLANPVIYPIPAPDSGGLLRIDNIVADYNGNLTYQTGVADASAIAPEVPYKYILVTTIYVSLAETVEDPAPIPVTDGETLFGAADPLSSQGKTGDTYVQQTTGTIWKKELVGLTSTWVLKYSLPMDSNLVHLEGDETINDTKTFTSSPTVPDGIEVTDAASIGNIIQLPNDIRFQRIQRVIPRIRVVTSAPGKCREFLRMVAANNYTYCRIYVVNQNSTVKDFEFLSGYDALSESNWSELVPLNVYNDRGEDFKIEIKKVSGFGPTNFGIIFRYHNTNASGGSEASIKLDFALELPAVGVNYDQFAYLTTTEYDFSGSTTLYGRKMTIDADGLNMTDSNGYKFQKEIAISETAPATPYFHQLWLQI